MMDTHCVAGTGMQEKLAHLAGSEESDKELFTNIDGSSTTTAMIPSSLPTAAMMSSSYTPLEKVKFGQTLMFSIPQPLVAKKAQ